MHVDSQLVQNRDVELTERVSQWAVGFGWVLTLNQSLVVEASASQNGWQVFTAVAAGARKSPYEQHDGVIQKLVSFEIGQKT